jgi:hypothetical protein
METTMTLFIGGGSIKDYPNAKRKFPGRTKRLVRISARMYYGIGKHYWITMHEENNPIWDAKEKAWRECWDDLKKNGRIESQSFLSIVSAKLWIEEVAKKYFPKKTHKLQDIDFGGLTEEDEKRWLGIYKEGD